MTNSSNLICHDDVDGEYKGEVSPNNVPKEASDEAFDAEEAPRGGIAHSRTRQPTTDTRAGP